MERYKIQLQNQKVEFQCDKGDTILRAALRAGLNVPYECNSGGCGSCKFELVEGHVENLWEEAPGLSERDKLKGKMLSCQCRPTKDSLIKIKLTKNLESKIRPVRMKAELYRINHLTDDMREYCFRTQEAAYFIPGQFALFDFPCVDGSRGYSMSNLPNEEGLWKFIIKKTPKGKATNYLFDYCNIGMNLEFDGPYGLAYFRPEASRDIVLIGGGSGLSPIVSIAKSATRNPSFKDKNIYMFYGGRSPKDICTPQIVSNDKYLKERLNCFDAISDSESNPDVSWDGECCFIHELVAKKLGTSLPKHEFYFCGPPAMIEAILKMLIMEYKVPFDQIHYDRFY